ncbi:MAG: tetratricopeptide repeat protein [Cyclonatronaceae bacterium]
MADRLSKDELQNDALVTSYAYALEWYHNNKNLLFAGIAALILIVGGSIWYVTNTAQQQEQAREAISFAEGQFLNGNYETALFGNDEQGEPGLTEIISEYPRTTAGNLARYYAAVSYAELEDYTSALEMIREYEVPEGVLGVAPVSLQGMILMQLEDYEQAVEVFERAAGWDENESTTPFNLLNAGEAAYAAGNYTKAQELARRIQREFPDSQQAPRAMRLEGMVLAAE